MQACVCVCRRIQIRVPFYGTYTQHFHIKMILTNQTRKMTSAEKPKNEYSIEQKIYFV